MYGNTNSFTSEKCPRVLFRTCKGVEWYYNEAAAPEAAKPMGLAIIAACYASIDYSLIVRPNEAC